MAKKWFIVALGVLLMAAFSAPVMGETKVEFKGSYRVRYYYIQNITLAPESDQERQSNYFDQRFRIEPKFIVSDELSLTMRINGLNGSRWGDANGVYGPQATYEYGGGNSDSSFDIERVYMTIKTDFGAFLVGRMSGGAAGLMPLGYVGGRFAVATGFNESDPFDSEGPTHRIVYQLPVGNFQITALYEKIVEQDWRNQGNQPALPGATQTGWDDDSDAFALVPQYKWASGVANMTLYYARNHSNNEPNALALGTPPMDINLYFVDAAVIQAFGPFSLHFEGQYRWGTMDWDRWLVPNSNLFPDMDFQGWGVYLDGIYDFGPGEVGLLFMYTQGADPYATASDVQSGQLASGADHVPFLVAYDRGVNSAYVGGGFATQGVANAANHWNLGLWCDYDITESMMLHAALGYFQINETPNGWGDHFGWELDLGFTWQLMDGLRYTTMAGYFFPGDYNEAGNTNNEYGSAWAWKNQLQLSF
jgi:hypothetical protein